MDNWKHRSKAMSCECCMYFVAKKSLPNITTIIGRCRRNPPTHNGWVAVFNSDWCGQHKLDENKLENHNGKVS